MLQETVHRREDGNGGSVRNDQYLLLLRTCGLASFSPVFLLHLLPLIRGRLEGIEKLELLEPRDNAT